MSTGAQAERGRKTSPIGDSPGSHDGAIASDLGDLRDQHQSADKPAVSARLATLGDDDGGAAVDSTTCLVEIHHLLHPQAASGVSSIDKLTWIAHVVRDHCRPSFQGCLECLRAERSGLMIDGKGPVGQFAKLGPLLLQLLHRTYRRSETAQAACLADRGGKPDRVPRTEGRADDGHADIE